jgi:hypothetical protein
MSGNNKRDVTRLTNTWRGAALPCCDRRNVFAGCEPAQLTDWLAGGSRELPTALISDRSWVRLLVPNENREQIRCRSREPLAN